MIARPLSFSLAPKSHLLMPSNPPGLLTLREVDLQVPTLYL